MSIEPHHNHVKLLVARETAITKINVLMGTLRKCVKKTDLVYWFINIQVLLTSEEITTHFQSKCEGLHRYYIGGCTGGSSRYSFGLSRIPELCAWCSFGSAMPLVRWWQLFVGMRFLISVAILISLDYPLYYAYGSSEAIIIWKWRVCNWENYLKLIMSFLVWIKNLFNLKLCLRVLILSKLFQKSCQCLRYMYTHDMICQPLQLVWDGAGSYRSPWQPSSSTPLIFTSPFGW